MMKFFRKISIIGILTGVMMAQISNLAFAEDFSSTLTVSPPNQKIILVPGETFHGTIDITNPLSAKSDLKYKISIGSFSQNKTENSRDDYGDVDIVGESSYNQIIQWIKLDQETGSVAPNKTETVGFSIVVPKNAPAGGQYATLLVSDDYVDSIQSNGDSASIASISQVASIIYAEVAGETRQAGKITENNIPSFLFDGKLEATSMVRNDGNVHTDAEYIFQVWPMFSGEEICTNEENISTSLILPNTERYHTETCQLPAVGLFRAKQTVKIFGEESIVEKTIIVCPLWLIFVILFIVIALIIWIVIRIRSRKKA